MMGETLGPGDITLIVAAFGIAQGGIEVAKLALRRLNSRGSRKTENNPGSSQSVCRFDPAIHKLLMVNLEKRLEEIAYDLREAAKAVREEGDKTRRTIRESAGE